MLTTAAGPCLVYVPPGGLVGSHAEMTFQVPLEVTFVAMAMLIPGRIRGDRCHVVVTVAAFNMTMDDKPQGEPDAVLTIDSDELIEPFYFGVFPFNNDTNPFARHLNSTR